ncbi:hypothetical protein [Xanthomonas citri]|uniref:hypothetical protein n=1 Tax=Xanthomonas citri TaxID=346 RepID=UPI003FA28783
MLQGFPGVFVLVFQRFRMGVVLGQSRREARDPLQLGQFGGAAGHFAPGSVARLAFGLQRGLAALQLRPERASLLPGLLQRLGAFCSCRWKRAWACATTVSASACNRSARRAMRS